MWAALINKDCTDGLNAALPGFGILFVAISITPGPVSIESLFRVNVEVSLNALAGDSRWHWFYQVALATMLHQRYFGSRNALIHCVILKKADV